MTQWLVMEAYNDLYYTTGVTYQADNQPTPTTVLGAGVDVSVLPIIGLGGRMDWGVHAYDPTRHERHRPAQRRHRRHGQLRHHPQRARPALRGGRGLAARHPGPDGRPVRSRCPAAPTPAASRAAPPTGAEYELDRRRLATRRASCSTPTSPRPGSSRPAASARDVDGDCVDPRRRRATCCPRGHATGQHRDCLEGPLMGIQFQTGLLDRRRQLRLRRRLLRRRLRLRHRRLVGTRRAPIRPTRRCAGGQFTALTPATTWSRSTIPNDAARPPAVQGHPGRGHQHRQRRPVRPAGPAAGVRRGAAHRRRRRHRHRRLRPVATVNGVTVPASTPSTTRRSSTSAARPTRASRSRCATPSSSPSANGKSIAPTFNVFTDVPVPGRFWGLVVDDLNFSTDPKALLVRREGRRPVRAGRHLRLHEPPRLHRRVRLQRPVRRAAAVDQPHQLPDPVGRLRQHVPLRRQRPGIPGT